MCSPKSSPYSKSNSSWPLFSTGIASCAPSLEGLPRDVGPELLVDEDSGAFERKPGVERSAEAGEDDRLGLLDPLHVVRRGLAGDPEELLLKRSAVVECEEVDGLGITVHVVNPFGSAREARV